MKFSERLNLIQPYLFAELDRIKSEKEAQGADIISLGIGDPGFPTAPFVVEAMKKAVEKPENHQYPPYEGTSEFRSAMADFYKRRFGVTLNPKDEVLALIGSKEGIAHICMAVLDPGDVLLYPDPGYPVYKIGAAFSGAEGFPMPLLKENKFLPDFTKVPENVARRAKMMFLNYPNNPTSASADLDFYREAIRFAKKYEILIASDNAYSEIFFDENNRPPSILSVEGAKDVAVEFFSLSKPYNMTGWRIASLLGDAKAVNALGTFKKNIDSGTFTAVQEAGAVALREGDGFIAEMRKVYKKRRDKMCEGLKSMGINIEPPSCTFYLWAPTPGGLSSMEFTKTLLDKTGVMVTPGSGFGQYGEGYFRISLTLPDHRIDEAVERMKKASLVVK